MATNAARAIESAPIEHWPEVRAELLRRIADRFRRVEVRERGRQYLLALLDRVEHKNGWQLAEAIGGHGPQGVQRRAMVAHWAGNDQEGIVMLPDPGERLAAATR